MAAHGYSKAGCPVAPQQALRKQFDEHLADIDAKVIRLFALVTEAIAAATGALLADDVASARAIAQRDIVVDQLEADLEGLAQRELVRQAPVAGDMRYLISVIRVVPELERSGDLAQHVAQRAARGLAARLTPSMRAILDDMGMTAVAMWRAVADAWAERDAGAAEEIDSTDEHIDSLHKQLIAQLINSELELDDAVQTTLVGRFYERLGDHAVHIAERIRYLATGAG
jgi:phosphate transport system protein